MAGAAAERIERGARKTPTGARLEVVSSPTLQPQATEAQLPYEQRRDIMASFIQGLEPNSPGWAAVLDHVASFDAFTRMPNDPSNIDSTGSAFGDDIDLKIRVGRRRKFEPYNAAYTKVREWTNEVIDRRNEGRSTEDVYGFYRTNLQMPKEGGPKYSDPIKETDEEKAAEGPDGEATTIFTVNTSI